MNVLNLFVLPTTFVENMPIIAAISAIFVCVSLIWSRSDSNDAFNTCSSALSRSASSDPFSANCCPLLALLCKLPPERCGGGGKAAGGLICATDEQVVLGTKKLATSASLRCSLIAVDCT